MRQLVPSKHVMHFFILIACAMPVLAHPLPDSTRGSALGISSIPPAADVYVDGLMAGITPLTVKGVQRGTHLLEIRKDGYCRFFDTLAIARDTTMERFARLDSACGITITTSPDSAGVYVGNLFVGKSPVQVNDVRPGWTTIKIVKRDFALWEDRLYIKAGESISRHATMKSKYGTLTLEVFSPDVEVLVDGKSLQHGSLVEYMIPSGMHDLTARTADNSREVNETVFIGPGDNSRWVARLGVPSRRALWYSLACPGLGQLNDGATAKGTMILGGFIASVGFSVAMHIDYSHKLTGYDSKHDAYAAIQYDEGAAKSAGDELQTLHRQLLTSFHWRSVGVTVAALIYVYSLVDAYLFHSTESSITSLSLMGAPGEGPSFVATHTGERLQFHISL